MGEMTVLEYTKKLPIIVFDEIQKKTEKGLTFPEGYNVQNALTKAVYQIKEAVDKDKRPVLQTCTPDSIQQAIMDMLVAGLDPNKGHVYWIAYDGKLKMTESYFGKVFRTKRADPNIKYVGAEIVYEKDTFKYEIKHGTKVVTEHLQSAESVDSTKIKGAYATILYIDGTEVSEYMTMKQIQTSWNQSKTSQDVHKKFPEQMAKRTVLSRLAGMVLKTGTTDILLGNEEFAGEFDQRADEQEATEPIDITPVVEQIPEKKAEPTKQAAKKEQKQEAQPEQPELDFGVDIPECLR